MIEELAERIRILESQLEEFSTRDFIPNLGARVYNTSAVTITNNSLENLTFDTERFDNGDFWEGVTNPSRLTIPEDGIYLVSASIRWASNTTGNRLLSLRVNATTVIAGDRKEFAVATTLDQNIMTLYKFTAADYVEVRVYQNSGGDLDVTAAGNRSPEFSILRVG